MLTKSKFKLNNSKELLKDYNYLTNKITKKSKDNINSQQKVKKINSLNTIEPNNYNEKCDYFNICKTKNSSYNANKEITEDINKYSQLLNKKRKSIKNKDQNTCNNGTKENLIKASSNKIITKKEKVSKQKKLKNKKATTLNIADNFHKNKLKLNNKSKERKDSISTIKSFSDNEKNSNDYNNNNINNKKVNKKTKKDIKNIKNKEGYFPMNRYTRLYNDDCGHFLIGICKNKFCKYIHNFTKLHKNKMNEEFSKRYYLLHKDFNTITPYQKKICKKNSLDIMFIMNCSASMTKWIKKCQNKIENIINCVKEIDKNCEVNISFVGYRDFSEKEKRHFCYPFSLDIDKAIKFINNIKVIGGDDIPENLTGALDLALKQDWKSLAKYAIIITDSPCHGKKYHGYYGDYLPKYSHNNINPEVLIAEFAKKEIIVSAIQINKSLTKKMFDILNKSYKLVCGKSIIFEELDSDTSKFGIIVGHRAATTLNSITFSNITFKDILKEIKKDLFTISNKESNNDSVLVPKTESYSNENKLLSLSKLHDFKSIFSDNIQDNDINENSFILNKEKVSSDYIQHLYYKITTIIEDQEDQEDNNRNININNKYNKSIRKEKNVNPSTYKEELLNLFFDNSKYQSIFKQKNNIITLNYQLDTNNLFRSKFCINSKYEFKAVCYSFNIPNNRNTFIEWENLTINSSFISCNVVISDKPFSEGSSKYAFYMKDLTLNQNLVGKLYKVSKLNENGLYILSKDIISLTICKRIAYDFNNRITNILPDNKYLINFVNAYVYELMHYTKYISNNIQYSDIHTNKSCENNRLPSHQQYYLVENYIEGEYNKYNNNAGWINSNLTENSEVAQAFSHFSWQITRGYLMIVDLQGVEEKLTDPQIHCIDDKKFGKGNLGNLGIIKFFISHECNTYCKYLELIHPKDFVKIDENYDFFVEKFTPPVDNNKLIKKMCDLCTKTFLIKAIDLFDKKKKFWDAFCPSCDKRRIKSFTKNKCSKCFKPFVSSAFYYMMKRTEFPSKCQKCIVNSELNNKYVLTY